MRTALVSRTLWLSIPLTVAVIVNIVALGKEEPAVWVGLLALFPLALLLFSGLYLFALPYVTRRRLASPKAPS